MSTKGEAIPQYLGSGDPALVGYYPKWVDNLADDATVEGSMLDGIVQGGEAVRSVVVGIRSLYDRQAHKFAGPYGNHGFLEDYVAEVRGKPLGCVVLVSFNAAGKDPTRRGQLSATQLRRVLRPPAGREVRRYPHCQTLRRQRALKRARRVAAAEDLRIQGLTARAELHSAHPGLTRFG